MEQLINPAIVIWSAIVLATLVSFALNAYAKVKEYNKRFHHIFIDADAILVVGWNEEPPLGCISLEMLQENPLAA